jgi:hypothetical protein
MTVAPDPSPPPETIPPPQMPSARRRVALIVLSVLFALWMAALAAMYVATVYPRRHPKAGPPAVSTPGQRDVLDAPVDR